MFGAASESFSQRTSTARSRRAWSASGRSCAAALAKGVRVRGYVSCVVGCPYEGEIAPAAVARVARELLRHGLLRDLARRHDRRRHAAQDGAMLASGRGRGAGRGARDPPTTPTARRWPTCYAAWSWASRSWTARSPASAAALRAGRHRQRRHRRRRLHAQRHGDRNGHRPAGPRRSRAVHSRHLSRDPGLEGGACDGCPAGFILNRQPWRLRHARAAPLLRRTLLPPALDTGRDGAAPWAADAALPSRAAPDYLARNPLGTIPLLEDGDVRMARSAAICQYLVGRFMVPRPWTWRRRSRATRRS